MDGKEQTLRKLKEEFHRWEDLLAGLTPDQITARQLAGGWSIKDVIAHLMTWQKRSIARMEAGLANRAPVFPKWPGAGDPDHEESPDETNAWIYQTNRDRPWADVYRDWREGYLRFIQLSEAVPEPDLMDADRFAWMEGYPLGYIMQSSYDHHHEEHYEPLVSFLKQQGDIKAR